MSAQPYPGNVRELRNLVERLAILSDGPTVSAAQASELLLAPRGQPAPDVPRPGPTAPAAATPDVGSKPFRELVEDAEREIIVRTLAFTGDNVTEAARLLDLERGHFYKKMKALGLRRGPPEGEPASG